VPIVLKTGSLNLWEPSGPFQACTGIALPCILIISVVTCPHNKTGWRKMRKYLKLKFNKIMYTNIFTSVSVLVDCKTLHVSFTEMGLSSLWRILHSVYICQCNDAECTVERVTIILHLACSSSIFSC
jgi:hypothetical protein